MILFNNFPAEWQLRPSEAKLLCVLASARRPFTASEIHESLYSDRERRDRPGLMIIYVFLCKLRPLLPPEIQIVLVGRNKGYALNSGAYAYLAPYLGQGAEAS